MQGPSSRHLTRRRLLASTAAMVAVGIHAAWAVTVQGTLPWRPNAADPPAPVHPGPWVYFTPEEGAAVETLVDRLIPPDPVTPGGKDAGCAVFIDRQLAGPYGRSEALYMQPPFANGTPQQGLQSALTPAQWYRKGLAALDAHCRAGYAGKSVSQIPDSEKDALLTAMEKGELQFPDVSAKGFFDQLLQNTKEGFFADPLYGGNRDMVAWRMIGFPGTQYDYRDWIGRHNERYPLPPISIYSRSGPNPKGT